MSRLTIGLVLVSSLAGAVAHAQSSQADIAAKENDEGKQLMFENKYAEASVKFQSAHSRVPEPKYFFNHCTSLFWEGKFGEALTACNAADKNADDKLKAKIATFEGKIRDEAKKQNITIEPVGGGAGPGEVPPPTGDPNNPGTGNPGTGNPGTGNPGTGNPGTGTPGVGGPGTLPAGQPPAVGRPPSMGLFSQSRPENTYTWSVGLDFFGGGGRMGRRDFYGHSAGGFRVKADYILNPKQRIGTEGYIQVSNFSASNDAMATGGNLSVFDLGLAAYKHLCGPYSHVCLTPLAGVQLAMMNPGDQADSSGQALFNYAALGGRLEMALSFALGARYQHVISGQLGLNVYTGSFSEPSDGQTSAELGLDHAGAALFVGAGYTYRFNTPFGSAPFVTLE